MGRLRGLGLVDSQQRLGGIGAREQPAVDDIGAWKLFVRHTDGVTLDLSDSVEDLLGLPVREHALREPEQRGEAQPEPVAHVQPPAVRQHDPSRPVDFRPALAVFRFAFVVLEAA